MSSLSHFITSALAFLGALFPTVAAVPVPVSIFSPAPPHATVLFGGDMMFDRTIRSTMEEEGDDFIFSCLNEILQNADLVVANLEGPITEHASMSLGSEIGTLANFTFTFPLETAALLARHNITLVNLGNNHIQNFGWDGVRSTVTALSHAGVGYFGDPPHYGVAEEDINGVPLTFINYNEFGGNAAAVVAQIKEARVQSRLPIVYAHWGIEYATTSSAYSRELAHSFIDAGASIVVGSHPHVVQEHEEYRGSHIYYSLGNFIFDQYWNDTVRTGLMLRVIFNSDGVEHIQEIPIELRRDRRTCVIE